MKFLIVFVALFALALAADVSVIEQSSDVQPDSFKAVLKQSDGTNIVSAGQLNNVGTENEALEVTGSYTYTDNEGIVHSVNYRAGVDGFQPEGADIPVAPTA